MTTDNRTNEPTPEQAEAAMFQLFPITVRYDGCDVPNPGAADKREGFKAGIEYMRGLLSEGAPSEAQARAIRKLDNMQAILAGAQASITDAVRELSLTSAALVAAHGATPPVNSFDTTAERVKTGADSLHVAPQEPSGVTDINGHSWMTWDESGKNGTYCRSCGGWAGKVGNRQCSPAPVLPSSGVDEDKLAEVIASVTDLWDDPLDEVHDIPQIARAVAAWLKDGAR